MRKFNFLLIVLFALSLFLVNCSKNTESSTTTDGNFQKASSGKLITNGHRTLPVVSKASLTGATDNQCGSAAAQARGLTAITFGDVPSSSFYTFTSATDLDLDIFAQDCCIRDDVVEVYVDNCLVATVDSRCDACGFGTHAGQTTRVTLKAGTHTVEYRNTVSLPGASGWTVSETELPATMLTIDGCNTGVANLNASCGAANSFSALIANCAANARNHGQFVSCVAALTNGWLAAGLITSAQKDAIMSCAGQAHIPK